jgi:small subunit ribosomal protein S16
VPVKIRLRVVGKRKQRSYRIVAIESRNPRDGKYLEQLGWYNPRSKELQIDEEGIKKWQEKGAVLTDAVKNLLKRPKEEASPSTKTKTSEKKSKKKSKKKSAKKSTKTSTGESTEASKEEKTKKEIKESTEEKNEEDTEKSTEESTDTGKTEEVSDVEGTDNLHSEVSGGST